MGLRNDILDDIKMAVLNVSDLTDDRVAIGLIVPQQAGGSTVSIVPEKETSDWQDGNEISRKLQLVVMAQVRVDESQSGSQFDQLNALWDLVEAQLEDLIVNAINGKADRFQEDEGVEWEKATLKNKNKDQIAALGASYIVEYTRTLGT